MATDGKASMYPNFPPPVATGGPPMATGGLPWVVSTGKLHMVQSMVMPVCIIG